MKILVLTIGDQNTASSRSRVYQYIPYLKQRNIFFRIVPLSRKGDSVNRYVRRLVQVPRFVFFLFYSLFFRIVFIQKVLLHPFLILFLKLTGKKIIFDFDDAIYTVSEFVKDEKSNFQLNLSQKLFNNIVKRSDLILLENEQAKSIVEKLNSNILLFTGPIETERYKPSPKPEASTATTVIGWIGSPSTTEYLNSLENVFRRLVKELLNFEVVLIGADESMLKFRNESWVKFKKWNLETETLNLQSFDIGIMPLVDDEWSRGKGGYKLLQYMSLGIPSVASPVGINSQLIINDIDGYLADNEDEWFDKLVLLIKDRKLRKSLGEKARVIAVEQYSFHLAARQLEEKITQLL